MNVGDCYDNICEQWHDFRKNCTLNSCIAKFIGLLEDGCAALDVGCGTGYPVSASLAERGFYVTGIDLSEKMIGKAKKLRLPHAQFFVHDFLSYRPRRKFGAIIAFDSLWHIPHGRQREIYPAAASLLSDGGYFLFTHGKSDGEVTGEMFGQTFYYSALDVGEVRSLLIANGFEILSLQENYSEKSTGTRDLLVVARKKSDENSGQY